MSLSRSVAISFFMMGCLGVSLAAGMPAFAQSPETAGSHAAPNQPAANHTPANQAPTILPPNFAGWQMQGAAAGSTDPAAADPTRPAGRKKHGFSYCVT